VPSGAPRRIGSLVQAQWGAGAKRLVGFRGRSSGKTGVQEAEPPDDEQFFSYQTADIASNLAHFFRLPQNGRWSPGTPCPESATGQHVGDARGRRIGPPGEKSRDDDVMT